MSSAILNDMESRLQPIVFLTVLVCTVVFAANVGKTKNKHVGKSLSGNTFSFQRFYEITPKYLHCHQLDTELVSNFSCTVSHVNRTTLRRDLELIFRPGVALTNYHVNVVEKEAEQLQFLKKMFLLFSVSYPPFA